jgi:hypothetical protein
MMLLQIMKKNSIYRNNAENAFYFRLWDGVIGEIVFGRSLTYTSVIYDHTLFENVARTHTTTCPRKA